MVVCHVGFHCDFDVADSVHYQQAEMAVENVAGPDVVEARARTEGVVAAPKRVPVPAQPVVVDRRETLDDQRAIAFHATPHQEVGLLLEAQRGLRVLQGRVFWAIKNPP